MNVDERGVYYHAPYIPYNTGVRDKMSYRMAKAKSDKNDASYFTPWVKEDIPTILEQYSNVQRIVLLRAPGHSETSDDANYADHFLTKLLFVVQEELANAIDAEVSVEIKGVVRTTTVEKSTNAGSKRTIKKCKDSCTIALSDRLNDHGTVVIVIDDVTTSGSTLLAIKELISESLPECRVALYALMKTTSKISQQ